MGTKKFILGVEVYIKGTEIDIIRDRYLQNSTVDIIMETGIETGSG